MKKYIRDGRAPIPDLEVTSRVMSANKGKDTRPEILMRMALREVGLSGYRLHWKKVPGSPDISGKGHRKCMVDYITVFYQKRFWEDQTNQCWHQAINDHYKLVLITSRNRAALLGHLRPVRVSSKSMKRL